MPNPSPKNPAISPISGIRPISQIEGIAPLKGGAAKALTDLPILLAGPIIRRAETTGVWIWIATSEKVSEVRPILLAYDISLSSAIRKVIDVKDPVASKSFRCVQLGAKLWVSLFRIVPKQGTIPTDVIIGYDFAIRTKLGIKFLEDLVKDKKSDLCYHPYPDPTFILPSRDGYITQASCRRPGAHGQDAFYDFDWWLSERCDKTKLRPAALFLGGDQIYADDVAYSLFESVRALTTDIMGYDELLPEVPYIGGKWALLAAGLLKYSEPKDEVNRRREILLKVGITTDDGEGHLMSFGEFAAMYLLVWNPVLCAKYQVEKDHGIDPDDTRNLEEFTMHVTSARRVLANIPTYMAFDDHEITDDWNLDEEWVKGTTTPLARRVLTNGLAACWFFQAWGNVPELFGNGSGAQTTNLIENRLAALAKVGVGNMDGAIDINFEKAILNREPWAYVAPTNPPVLVTDLRTHRKLGATPIGTSLLNQEGYDQLAKICRDLPANKPLVLLSPTPLLPWLPVMSLRDLKMKYDVASPGAFSPGVKGLLKIKGVDIDRITSVPAVSDQDMARAPMGVKQSVEFGDMWHDHRQGMVDFIEWVHNTIKPSYCVVFSGDVHHGFMVKGKAKMQASWQDARELWSLDIVQITSSPIKNESGDLSETYKGIPAANLLDTALPTSGIKAYETSSRRWLYISFDAVELKGMLTLDPLKAALKVPLKKSITGTVIFRNHVCVVDFTLTRRVGAEFIGNLGPGYRKVSTSGSVSL